MEQGIRRFSSVLNNATFTTNVVLATIGLTSPIAAGERQKFRAWIPFTVGATGGIRFEIIAPAAVALFLATIKVFNTVAPSMQTASQLSAAAFTDAVANAGTSWMEVEADITNGVNAGVVDFQMAQNTSDANTLTVLKGGSLDVTVY